MECKNCSWSVDGEPGCGACEQCLNEKNIVKSEYEVLIEKSEICKEAAMRCVLNNKINMTIMWTSKSIALYEKARDLTI